jgi:trimeric autotransporter adhesin
MKQTLAIWILTAATALAQSTVTGSKTMQGSWDASGATATKPAKSGATLPSTCGAGEFFFNTAAAAGQNLYLCASANTWTQLSAGVNSVFGRAGVVSAQSGDYNFSQLSGTAGSGQLPAAGGDLSGSLPSATVKGIQGKAVSTTAPATGQVLGWNGSQWTPQAVSSAVGGDLSGTIAAATVQGIQGKAVSSAAPSSGQALVWSGSQWVPQTISSAVGGDLSGTTAAATVQALQGRSLSAAAPATGQVLTWNGSVWLPQNSSGSGGGGIPEAVVFDASSTSLSDGSTVTWSACGTNAMCASWTVPGGVSWVLVDAWAGGGPGLGAGSGNGGAGGAGGGYGHRMCPVSAGGTVTVQVGLGGIPGSGYGASVTQGGDSSFGICIGATAGLIVNGYAYGNPPGVMKVNGQAAPPGPWLSGNGYWNTLTGVSGGAGSPSYVQTTGYAAVREDQGGWPGSGWFSGSTGVGYAGGTAIGGGAAGGGGAAQNASGGAAGTSLFGGAGGVGGSSAGQCTNGGIPGGGGGGAYVPASGSTSGCNGARGEVRVYYVN